MATCENTSSPTIEAFLCDNCRCPIGTMWDVLPAEVHAPAWKDHVYSYELDLFDKGAPPIQAYSATNPSKRRFDLLRLAPHVTVQASPAPPSDAEGDVQAGAEEEEAVAYKSNNAGEARRVPDVVPLSSSSPAALLQAPSFVQCDTAVYSSEHSFFTGYAWCFAHCGNCGAFLGWGFAAEARLRRDEERDSTEEGERVIASTRGVSPDFIGIIITHCTGDPRYPVETLRSEVEWRPWRLQRRARVEAITHELRQLLAEAADCFYAHRIYYTFESIVGHIMLTPPATPHPIVGQDDVPQQLLDLLEVARGSAERQRDSRTERVVSPLMDSEDGDGESEEEEEEEDAPEESETR